MRNFNVLFLIFFPIFAWTQNIEVQLNPEVPTVNETFDLIVKITTKKGEGRPSLSFDYGKLQLVGNRSEGVSINTTIINGKMTMKKEHTVVYSFLAKSPGSYVIKDIVLQGGTPRKIKDTIQIDVVAERKGPRNFFVKAILSKNEVYFQEGIDANFYLYFSPNIEIHGEALEAYPQFTGFIKRFHQVRPSVEKAKLKGITYYRKLLYSARIYPEKLGQLKIGPLRITIQYSSSEGNMRGRRGVFGLFGMGMMRTQTKSLASLEEEVLVKELPVQGKPKSFTGLIGDHDFKIELNREKFLINEAVELKLTVTGPGAVEHYDAPKLITSSALEEFDTKSDLSEIDFKNARKTFEYTYLAKEAISMKGQVFDFYTFNPKTGQYVKQTAELKGLEIGGVATSAISSKKEPNLSPLEKEREEVEDTRFLAPIFEEKKISSYTSWTLYGLLLLNFFLLGDILFRRLKKTGRELKLSKLCQRIKNDLSNYSLLHHLILHLAGGQSVAEPSISQLIKDSFLSKEAQDYFFNLIDLAEKKSFGSGKTEGNLVYEEKYFKEIQKLILKHDESSPGHRPH